MPEYVVSWEINLDADTPHEAAEKALAIHRDPTSIAYVFTVVDGDGTEHHVDLAVEDVEEDEPTYSVWCYYQDDAHSKTFIDGGLTLEEAKAICNDPDTSSRTTTTAEGKRRTRDRGAWFYGFTED
jgi:hypothetical protein